MPTVTYPVAPWVLLDIKFPEFCLFSFSMPMVLIRLHLTPVFHVHVVFYCDWGLCVLAISTVINPLVTLKLISMSGKFYKWVCLVVSPLNFHAVAKRFVHFFDEDSLKPVFVVCLSKAQYFIPERLWKPFCCSVFLLLHLVDFIFDLGENLFVCVFCKYLVDHFTIICQRALRILASGSPKS